MTDTELQKQIERAEQDVINLDYSKWSFERRRAGLTFSHDEWQKVRGDTLFRQKWDDEALKSKRLAALEAKKQAEQAEDERRIDAELLPTKLRLKRDWLANNPNFTETDFEKKAWIHLRANLVEDLKESLADAAIQHQLATRRY